MKLCTACATRHPLSEFPRNRRTADGLNRKCRRCVAAYAARRHWATRHGNVSREAVPLETRVKVRKLLALARNPAATPAEAELAQSRARNLYGGAIRTRSMTSRDRLRRAGLL
jgi:hypothetical protein